MSSDSGDRSALLEHLASGVTTVCRCWSVTRRDAWSLGFTDHDRVLTFDGLTFRPETGMEASVLAQTTGLAVDNTEAIGVLSDNAIREADIAAGRFDYADVISWLVNWQNPTARMVLFRGTLGEIRRVEGGFHAELRGLTEALNQTQGRVYQGACSARLGDNRCKVNLSAPGLSAEVTVAAVIGRHTFAFTGLEGFEADWFARGQLEVLSGPAEGLVGWVKSDVTNGSEREIALWQELRAVLDVGDAVRLTAGCDRRAETCRGKFDNFLNFRGFPHIPGEDWLTSYPTSRGQNTGQSRNRFAAAIQSHLSGPT